MRDILQRLGAALRVEGFRGSGQNFRKHEDDFIFVVNFQGSKWGGKFFVNLGAQPDFIPIDFAPDLATLKEYECCFRRRVGAAWKWEPSESEAAALEAELVATQRDFFALALTTPASVAVDPPAVLVATYQEWLCGTAVRTVLYLARTAAALGLREQTRALADHGLAMQSGTLVDSELRQLKKAAGRGR